MGGELQPLAQNFKIVDENGFPTLYFIKWAQQRQIDIQESISLTEAQALIDTWAAQRDVFAGNGLTGGGDLSTDITLDVGAGTGIGVGANDVHLLDTAVTPGTYGDATHVGQFTVDQQGRITGATDVAISGGGGGSYAFNPPAAADFTLFSGDANNCTLTDDADVGLVLTNANASAAGILRGGYKALPAVGTDFSVVIRAQLLANVINYAAGGLVMYESGTNKGYHFGAWSTPANNQIRKTTLGGTFGGAPGYNNRPDIGNLLTEGWYKIARVGTTLSFGVSVDGKNFITYLSEAQNTYLTTAPDRIGPGFWLSHATELPLLTIPAWHQTGF